MEACPNCGHGFAEGQRSAAAMLAVARACRFPARTTQEAALLAALIAHTSCKSGDCWPSVKALTLATGMCRASVFACLTALCETGLVQRQRQARGKGQTVNRYRVFPSILPRGPPKG